MSLFTILGVLIGSTAPFFLGIVVGKYIETGNCKKLLELCVSKCSSAMLAIAETEKSRNSDIKNMGRRKINNSKTDDE